MTFNSKSAFEEEAKNYVERTVSLPLTPQVVAALNYAVKHPGENGCYLICYDEEGPYVHRGSFPIFTKEECELHPVVVSLYSKSIKIIGWHEEEYAGDTEGSESILSLNYKL